VRLYGKAQRDKALRALRSALEACALSELFVARDDTGINEGDEQYFEVAIYPRAVLKTSGPYIPPVARVTSASISVFADGSARTINAPAFVGHYVRASEDRDMWCELAPSFDVRETCAQVVAQLLQQIIDGATRDVFGSAARCKAERERNAAIKYLRGFRRPTH
jgi:hypothetical protein